VKQHATFPANTSPLGAADDLVCPQYPLSDIDLVRLNQIIRHRIRNVCGGCQMILDVLGSHLRGREGDTIEWDALYAEVDNVQQFSQRLDLLIAPLPPAQPMLLSEILAAARDAFVQRFPFCSLEMNGPDEQMELPTGNWLVIMLRELLANAGHAAGTDGGGAVEVAWAVEPDLQFVVANNGASFPAEVPVDPPIPFRSTAPSYDGLGLAIVHRLCLALGMEMTVRSDLPDMAAIMITCGTRRGESK